MSQGKLSGQSLEHLFSHTLEEVRKQHLLGLVVGDEFQFVGDEHGRESRHAEREFNIAYGEADEPYKTVICCYSAIEVKKSYIHIVILLMARLAVACCFFFQKLSSWP